ncbi:MAG: tyrosine-type recombinase/integrase [Firmicutes bacterium]|nr:tyrosine-type recombinase/integrase [Bacillota bacterium]
MSTNLSLHLPKVRVIRQAFIPSSWNPEDVGKLLAAIDRANPRGKRDYAILLMVIRLGLRVSDIRNLTLSNVNWPRKCLSIVMTKTQRSLELPLLDDVG